MEQNRRKRGKNPITKSNIARRQKGKKTNN